MRSVSEQMRAPTGSRGIINVSPERLNQLIESEITHFAMKAPSPVTLQQILDVPEPHRVAKFLHTELPTRFAIRIKQLESLPQCDQVEKLQAVRNVFVESF